MTAEPNVTYTYDDANRLTRMVRTDSLTGANQRKSEFVYDFAGRKRVATEFSWNAGAWEITGQKRYVYDGMEVNLRQRGGFSERTYDQRE